MQDGLIDEALRVVAWMSNEFPASAEIIQRVVQELKDSQIEPTFEYQVWSCQFKDLQPHLNSALQVGYEVVTVFYVGDEVTKIVLKVPITKG